MKDIYPDTNTLIKRIADYCKPEKIILFGSMARGDQRTDSDIDLLIIKKSKLKRPFRVKEIFESLRGMERNYALDPIVYTPEEIKERLALGDYFIMRILKEGKKLYG